MNVTVDILEDSLLEKYPEAFRTLLIDRTTNKNIFWATNDYKEKGEGFRFDDEIKPENITGENGQVVKPRALKHRDIQAQRSKDMAEVFTPSWVCNAQNNLIDEAWFGRPNVFNQETVHDDNIHDWETNVEQISFEDVPDNKTWEDYVCDTRLEITCGEAPYLVSRYDTTTGEYIEIKNRIGLLDRKLRVVSENCDTPKDWLKMARKAFIHTYGFEWQGDNLLIARESLLYTFIEYFKDKFGKLPRKDSVNNIAEIISWNLWQMDGLKFVLPCSCGVKDSVINQADIDRTIADNESGMTLFQYDVPEPIIEPRPCEGCQNGDNSKHNGIYAIIRNWDMFMSTKKRKDGTCDRDFCDVRFIDCICKDNKNN